MRPRHLGRSDLMTFPIGLNAASLAMGCGPVDPAAAAEVMSVLLETDKVLVDATGVESVIGRAMWSRRDRVVLASRPDRAGDRSPGGIAGAAEATLRGLRTDHLDLCYLDGLATASLEASVAALAALVEAGKVRHIGLFDVDAHQLRRAHAVHPVSVVAAEYSLLVRTVEAGLLPAARSLGVGLAAYHPLGRGVLTGALIPPVPGPRPAGAPPGRSEAVVRVAQRVAARRNLSVSRLALTWLLAQGDDIVALPATRSATHLEMNLAAAGLVLSPADRAELNSVVTSRTSDA